MPLTGNRLGGKGKFLYLTDDTTVGYVMRRDTDLAVAGFGVGANAPVPYDAANPPAGVTSIGPVPRGFKPRVVHLEDSVSGARKAMICFDPSSSMYQSTTAQTVDIDGLSFTSTGRRGEQLTF